jgi:hypothetical protein
MCAAAARVAALPGPVENRATTQAISAANSGLSLKFVRPLGASDAAVFVSQRG